VIPRDETIEYMRENYAQFQSALAMLDRMYEDPSSTSRIGRQNGHRHSFHNRSDALIELFEELTQAGHEYVLVGDTLSQRPMLASPRISISSSRQTQG